MPGWQLRIAASRLYVVLVLLFLFAPIAVVVAFSLNSSPSLAFPFTGVTVSWYGSVFGNSQFVSAFQSSAIAALCTGPIAGMVGALFAFGLARLSGRSRAALRAFILLPAVIPGLLLGISLTLLYESLNVPLGLETAISGHVLVTLPFVVLIVEARIDQLDGALVDAARDLGATRPRAFLHITWPLVRASVIGAVLLAMAVSLDEFVLTFFTIGDGQTLPVLIWGLLRNGLSPTVNAVATMILVASICLAAVAARTTRLRL